jgi:hypothetical protein
MMANTECRSFLSSDGRHSLNTTPLVIGDFGDLSDNRTVEEGTSTASGKACREDDRIVDEITFVFGPRMRM